MFEKVLIATDGSDESVEAAKVASQYIEQGLTKELLVLNIEPTFVAGTIDMGMTVGNVENWNSMAQEYGKNIIEETCRNIKGEATITKKVIMGDPASSICECAENNDCELIIMGSRGNSQLKGLLLGSVSTKVLHYAKCPVLVVKAKK